MAFQIRLSTPSHQGSKDPGRRSPHSPLIPSSSSIPPVDGVTGCCRQIWAGEVVDLPFIRRYGDADPWDMGSIGSPRS
ncbi:hypothetical protein P0O15_02195 [Methanotrichaceae archaeon Mx]|uniref:Uncharacterized protein n=1 Tax=Candidatus Methanocrinis natronophilus TaxID=3033396 RepID=A0ABT5X5M2_9EURY|nr:hypothetical protein [Candidatus Methanocrinis natronophilus]